MSEDEEWLTSAELVETAKAAFSEQREEAENGLDETGEEDEPSVPEPRHEVQEPPLFPVRVDRQLPRERRPAPPPKPLPTSDLEPKPKKRRFRRLLALAILVTVGLGIADLIGEWVNGEAPTPTTVVVDSIGEDAIRNRLVAECNDADFSSCDLLWVMSTPDSAYRTVAATCGGVSTPGETETEWCMTLQDSFVDFDLHDACDAGNFKACDLLFLLSPEGSEDEEFGATCGGRNEASNEQCLDRYGFGS
jgi:hypothetical protein